MITRVGINFGHTIAGYTVLKKAHSLSGWFALRLRLMLGCAFAHSGLSKISAAEPFSAGGYLANIAAANSNPSRTYRLDGFDPVVRRVRERRGPVGRTTRRPLRRGPHLGLDAHIESDEVDGRRLVERYPVFEYVLG